jgi:hypothetical protein
MATHNRNYGHLVPGRQVTKQEKWGRDTAHKRYGSLEYQFNAPPQAKDQSQPQDKMDKPDHAGSARAFNDAAWDWKRGGRNGGVESAEGYGPFDHLRGKEPTGSRGRRR